MKSLAAASLLLSLLASSASADVLLLAGGGRVEGVVTEKGDAYVVETLAGRAEIPKSDVLSRIEAPYVTERYERRLAKLSPDDAEGRFALSRWCREHGMERRAEALLEDVVRIDPDHAGARSALGHVRFDGAWMTREEARDARYRKAGLVEFEGRWFTPEGLQAWVEAKKELAELRAEEAARAAKRAAEEAERLRKEAEERRVREEALARVEEERRRQDRLERENDDLRDLVRDLLRADRDVRLWYGPSLPRYFPSPLGTSRGWSRSLRSHGIRGLRPGFDFRWTGDDFQVRGRVR